MKLVKYSGRDDKYAVIQDNDDSDVIGHLCLSKKTKRWNFYPSDYCFNAESMLFIAGMLSVCNTPDGIKKFL
jgi:hypothetical protein